MSCGKNKKKTWHHFTLKCFNTSWMSSCHAWNQPSGNAAVEKKKKIYMRLWARVVAMEMQWQTGQESWMLVSIGHRMSDGVWNSQGCNECCEVCWRARWWASALHLGLRIFGTSVLSTPDIGLKTWTWIAFIHFRDSSSYVDECI